MGLHVVIIKPSAVEKEVIRIVKANSIIISYKIIKLSKEFWNVHYEHVKEQMGKEFDKMVEYLSNEELRVMYIYTRFDIKRFVRMVYCSHVSGYKNLIHVSDTSCTAKEWERINIFTGGDKNDN